ncbi:MAG: integrase family protein [Gammaproteobacteria bacterium]|nr:integrase family protein [Gammaproteobacteria bacterium]MYB38940.1 integrase family protein [Gammaproteobacteria bacterium]
MSATFVRNANRPGRYGDGRGGLGRYPVLTLAIARERALENARAIAQGRDPRRSARAVPTFAERMKNGREHRVPLSDRALELDDRLVMVQMAKDILT